MSDDPFDPAAVAESLRGIERRIREDPEFKAEITKAINELFGDPATMTPGELMDAAAHVQRIMAQLVDVAQFGRFSAEPSDEARLKTSQLLDLVRTETDK